VRENRSPVYTFQPCSLHDFSFGSLPLKKFCVVLIAFSTVGSCCFAQSSAPRVRRKSRLDRFDLLEGGLTGRPPENISGVGRLESPSSEDDLGSMGMWYVDAASERKSSW